MHPSPPFAVAKQLMLPHFATSLQDPGATIRQVALCDEIWNMIQQGLLVYAEGYLGEKGQHGLVGVLCCIPEACTFSFGNKAQGADRLVKPRGASKYRRL
jgi:hypothetical protein